MFILSKNYDLSWFHLTTLYEEVENNFEAKLELGQWYKNNKESNLP
jgi:hypothetical protein